MRQLPAARCRRRDAYGDLAHLDDADGLGVLRMEPFVALALNRNLAFAAALRAADKAIGARGTAAALDKLQSGWAAHGAPPE